MGADVNSPLLKTPLHPLHIELGARMVPFAGYEMPVQYPAGLISEHKHTRGSASLFDVSHMGQLVFTGEAVGQTLEKLIPADIIGIAPHQQHYGLLLSETGGIIDDLMMVRQDEDFLMIVNGACKKNDLEHIQSHMGSNCQMQYLENQALLALQGPKAIDVMNRLVGASISLVFMTGNWYDIGGIRCYITRSGYTGEDGFEISVGNESAERLARLLLQQPEVMPAGLGARNSLRLEAGLCLYGSDMDTTTTPVEASLLWSIPKVRRSGGEREGGFKGAAHVLGQIDKKSPILRKRVGLVALDRVPVRDGTTLHDDKGQELGYITSGLLAPTCDKPIAMGYLPPDLAIAGNHVTALVRGKHIPMVVCSMPFVAHHYYRG